MKFVKAICLMSLFCLFNAFAQKIEPAGVFDVNAFVEKFKKLPDEEKLAFGVWLNERSAFKKDAIEDFAKKRFNAHQEVIKKSQQAYQDYKKTHSHSPDFATVNNSLRKSVDDAEKKEKESYTLKALIDEINALDLLLKGLNTAEAKELRGKISNFKIKLGAKVLSEISKDNFLNKFAKKGYYNFQEAMRRAIDKGDKDTFEYLVQKHVLIDSSDENYYNKFIQMKSHKPAAATGAK